MKIIKFVISSFVIYFFSAASFAETIDITEINQSVAGSHNFVTINLSENNYILVNNATDLELFYELGLIDESEFSQPSATKIINITGIYQSVAGDNNFITINQNEDKYILANVSRELDLLYELGLITEQEFNQPAFEPPVEDFAFFFKLETGELTLAFNQTKDMLEIFPDVIVPLQNRTTSLTSLPYQTIDFTTASSTADGLEVIHEQRELLFSITMIIDSEANEIILGFNKLAPEETIDEQPFTAIGKYYRKIF